MTRAGEGRDEGAGLNRTATKMVKKSFYFFPKAETIFKGRRHKFHINRFSISASHINTRH